MALVALVRLHRCDADLDGYGQPTRVSCGLITSPGWPIGPAGLGQDHARPRLHPSAHPLAYSLLEGALKLGDAARSGQGRQAAGARHRRHQQSVRRARIFREGGGQGRSSRCSARNWRSISSRSSDRVMERNHDRGQFGKGSVVLMAASETALPISRGSSAGPISRASRAGRRRSSTGSSRESLEGIICLTGGPEGAIDPYFAAGPRRAGGASARSCCGTSSATGSISSCSATAGRRSRPTKRS